MISLTSLVVIILIPLGGSIPGLGVCHQPYSGGYNKENATITICKHENKYVEDSIKYHETGHHLYMNIMTEKEKNEWNKVFDEHKKGKWNFYREYGMTNANEAMAEDIMTMYMKIPPRQLQKQRILLIKKYLRNHNLTL